MIPEKISGKSALSQVTTSASRLLQHTSATSFITALQTASSRMARVVAGKSIITLEDV